MVIVPLFSLTRKLGKRIISQMLLRSLFRLLVIIVFAAFSTACSTPSMTAPISLGRSSFHAKHFELPYVAVPDGNLWDDFQGSLGLAVDLDRPEIRSQIRWFQYHQEYLNRALARGTPYLYFMYQETQKLRLPAELTLVPLNESAYNPFLFSRAGATGLWQMMPGTGSGFGLKINWWYDGRRDVVASTQAALKYLTYLHYFFDDWLLAIAAYDAGEGTVQAAILRNQRAHLPTDFWSLRLPKETRAYVPKLLALAAIFKDPEGYGVKLLPVNNAPYFEQVAVESQIDLAQAAKLAGVTTAVIQTLNPGCRRYALDPDGPLNLLVPAATADTFKQRLAELPVNERVLAKHHRPTSRELANSNELTAGVRNASVGEERIPGPKQVIHTVRAGETLHSVAKKYGVKAHEVAYWNQISTNDSVTANDELVIWKKQKLHSKKHGKRHHKKLHSRQKHQSKLHSGKIAVKHKVVHKGKTTSHGKAQRSPR
jgi:membrane-bound lytic murein transglycosylase D